MAHRLHLMRCLTPLFGVIEGVKDKGGLAWGGSLIRFNHQSQYLLEPEPSIEPVSM
jgi:hypothetical protein